jgi:macrodomain Ter protein organizer (MatP/YcbG family)
MVDAMASTTIAVDVQVRDRLAAHAAKHGRTLGDEVEALMREREVREILAASTRIATDPKHADLLRASLSPAVRWGGAATAQTAD